MAARLRISAGLLLLLPLVAEQPTAPAQITHRAPISRVEKLQYGVEWRLMRAGVARVTWIPESEDRWQGELQLQSAGLVSKLYKVDDYYTVRLHDQLCADSILLKAAEGSKRRETKISFDRENGKASYLERDLLKNSTVLAKEIETPACVQDVIGGLFKLRTLKLEPGQSTTLPMSNGKKFVHVRVEAQEREEVKTRTGKYNTVRYEAFLFNNVLYSKKGRVFVWITDDARRLPVQIKAKMRFVIGTITLQLERDGATPAAGATPAGN